MTLIEIYWGEPISLRVSSDGNVKSFSTIEQAQYWLLTKWPVADDARHDAVGRLEAAMDCLGTVTEARSAFLNAARTAGFVLQDQADLRLAA